jgi:hypothetical protein
MGMSTSSRPESCVEVVVARMMFGLARAASVTTASVAVGASVATMASVASTAGAGVGAGDPQADNARETIKPISKTNLIVRDILLSPI